MFKKFIILCVVFLSCCGWKPVYYESSSDGYQPTAVVEIEKVPNYEGRLLTQKLKDILNPTNEQVAKTYVLKTQLAETLDSDQGIVGDNTSTRATMRITANFQLIDKKSGETVLDESTFAVASYNILSMPYPTVASEEATFKRLVDVVAEQIGTRIAVYFHKDEQ